MRKPDLTILTRDGGPYLERWWLIPRNKYFNVYLHKISDSDDDLALHDHPWFNCSIILKGSYDELTLTGHDKRFFYAVKKYFFGKHGHANISHADFAIPSKIKHRSQMSIVLRRPWTPHRLVVDKSKQPVWTLFITGPVIRKWGFHTKNGWVEHKNTGFSGEVDKPREDC